MSTSLTGDIPLVRICGQRDAALSKMSEAIGHLERGYALAEESRKLAAGAASGTVFSLVDRGSDGAYRELFRGFDGERSSLVFRHHTDACVWLHLLRVTGIEHLMDTTAREDFFKQLSTEVPAVTEENVRATFEGLLGDAQLIFQRGLARAFTDLDKRFKSHDAFRLGSRIILTNVFDDWGSWNYYTKARSVLRDVERVFAILDGKEPRPEDLERVVQESRGGGFSPRQGLAETRYFRIRTFKNGNAHLWFVDDDLVTRANLVLADYYGEVLPDGVPREDVSLRSKSGLPARDLSFYATPSPVVEALLRDLCLDVEARVLEPSAGTGNIARALLGKGYRVDAIEIDSGRVAQLSRIPGLTTLPGNFLRMDARPVYDAVIMNPPFYGTHWMEHVLHAFDFLAPGGTLRAVLPVTAEVGDTKKHKVFRTWASEHTRWGGELRFGELPAESFAESGTRINTVILTLHKES